MQNGQTLILLPESVAQIPGAEKNWSIALISWQPEHDPLPQPRLFGQEACG
ncbi:hypothetical protein ATPR_0935 [Acetobacter tropicalis NBRC 101654]|uniref:Uncharacterized protein n=1 Tax=Acetobacter tropicalis NBRC 101654 TaxID=749388 RepID=F7VC36_9PROT|nr:hypothetical protein ATPR_0935 [Acetobacter tropicalis NBRC 101654]